LNYNLFGIDYNSIEFNTYNTENTKVHTTKGIPVDTMADWLEQQVGV